mgnify:CR=1 FL=1
MAKKKGLPLGTFLKWFSSEVQCQEHLALLRWQTGYICPKYGCRHGYRLSNGRYQCVQCRHQTSVTAGTVLHKTHMPLTQWFLAFYFVSQDKRGISAAQLAAMLGTTYKTAWSMLRRIRIAMDQRDETHQLCGVIEFDNAYFGGPTTGKKRGRGTEKAKAFVALSLDEQSNPHFLKMRVTPNIKQVSVKKFVHAAFANDSEIHTDSYCSYIPALEDYTHEYQPYDPNSGLLHWLHIVISNAKAFILGTYHGLSKKYLQSYLDEYSFCFSRHDFGGALLECLTLAVSLSRSAEQKG